MFLYGASGHAKVVIEILEKCGIPIDGLFDDNKTVTNLCGYDCTQFDCEKLIDKQLIISIGDNRTRFLISEKIGSANYGLAVDINSLISKYSSLGVGSVAMPGAIINSGSFIGNHTIINTNAAIDHDCNIGNYVHISPGCSISGNVTVGEGTHVGTGSVIVQNIKIGKWSIVGAGSVIIRDIPDNVVVVGNPGKIIKTI